MASICTRMCPSPFFETAPPGAAPGSVETGARVRLFRGCNYCGVIIPRPSAFIYFSCLGNSGVPCKCNGAFPFSSSSIPAFVAFTHGAPGSVAYLFLKMAFGHSTTASDFSMRHFHSAKEFPWSTAPFLA